MTYGQNCTASNTTVGVMRHYQKITDALRAAYVYATDAPAGIAYSKSDGWFVYNPKGGCGIHAVPDFYIPAPNALPIPLNAAATQLLLGVIREAIAKQAPNRRRNAKALAQICRRTSAPLPLA